MFVGLTVSAWPGILSKMSQNKKLNTQREHRFRLREGNFQESVIKKFRIDSGFIYSVDSIIVLLYKNTIYFLCWQRVFQRN